MALARTFSRLCLAGLLLLAEWPAAAAEAGRPADEVARLIKQLGHAEFAQREAAERRLIEIGEPAIPALEKAARGDDPEVATRAGRALAALVSLDAKTVRELRAQGQRAFAAGDYAAMRAAYRRLSIAAAATQVRWSVMRETSEDITRIYSQRSVGRISRSFSTPIA